MKAFAELYRQLDETTKTNRKVAAMADYFALAAPEDAAWALYFLCGQRPKRLIKARSLAQWCAEEAGVSAWMFDECYDAVGDLAETMALLLPADGSGTPLSLSHWVEERLLPLRDAGEAAQRAGIVSAWRELSAYERFIWNKLITGELRVGVSQTLVVRALAQFAGVAPAVMSHRLMGDWQPTAEFFRALLSGETADADAARPYPFCLAHALQEDPRTLGDIAGWLIEWKWDGIRAQLVRRGEDLVIWSRGEDVITDRFPELHAAARQLPPGTVLDGEILGWRDGRVLPFAEMQRRIGRKQITKKILTEVPARFLAFDMLEVAGRDVRGESLSIRRAHLEELLAPLDSARIGGSEALTFASWDECSAARDTARERGVEGFMLKRLRSAYAVGRVTGDWWKWKIDPHTIDAVLVAAQRGHGRRASLYTDYTFALWEDGALVPFAKAYSGLSDEEIRAVDRFVRQNTTEKFGPVRMVQPQLVFELAFENIQRSTRHKSGVAVRFPRMNRWRLDKKPADADALETLRRMLPAEVRKPREFTKMFDAWDDTA